MAHLRITNGFNVNFNTPFKGISLVRQLPIKLW